MHIAIYHNLPSGGAKRSLFQWVQGLVQRHVVDVYCLAGADHDFCDLRPLVREYHILPFERLTLFDSPLGRFNQLQRWRDLRRLDKLARQMACTIDARHYDVVMAHGCLLTQAPRVLEYLRTPSVYYLQDLPLGARRSSSMPARSWRTSLDRIDPLIPMYFTTLHDMDRHAVQAATSVLTNSTYTAQLAAQAYGVVPDVVPLGVDVDSLRPKPHLERTDFVISVGEITPRKGHDFVIESLGRIPASERPALVLLGNMANRGERERLMSLAQQWAVALRIEVASTQASLLEWYNATPLLAYAPYQEPFGLVALEAMACGKPVVGVAEGGVRESVIDGVTGILTPRDSQLFGEAVQRLLKDAPLRAQYGRQAREHVVANWTWSASVARIEAFLYTAARREAA